MRKRRSAPEAVVMLFDCLVAVLFIATIVVACAKTDPAPNYAELQAQRDSTAHVADSLRIRLDSANTRLGRARELYLQQLEVTEFIRARGMYYATLVHRRPALSKYLVTWMRAAFEDADSIGGRR